MLGDRLIVVRDVTKQNVRKPAATGTRRGSKPKGVPR